MKKVLTLLLALGLLVSLAACGSGDGAATPATITEAPTDTPTEAPAEENARLLGAYENGVYTNEFLGIQCQLDETWTLATDEELGQLNGLTADAISDEALAEQLRNSGVVYGLYATANEGLVTMNIVFENLGLLYGTVLSEENYASLSVGQLPDALESAGFADVTAETSTCTFAGAEHAAVTVHGTYSDIDCYEKLVCVKVGSYIAVITVASYYEDITGDLLALYAPIDTNS